MSYLYDEAYRSSIGREVSWRMEICQTIQGGVLAFGQAGPRQAVNLGW